MTDELRDAHEFVSNDDEKILRISIGQQIRQRRKQQNLTVVQLSEASSISPAMISKIENGQTSASLGTLQRIAKGLGTSLSSFLSDFEEIHDVSFVKSGEGLEISRRGTRAGHQYRLLGHGVRTEVGVEPYLVTLTDRSDVFPWFQHGGVEFIYMLSGKMRYRHGETVYEMSPGDSLFFDPKSIHGPAELIELPIQMLSIISYSSNA